MKPRRRVFLRAGLMLVLGSAPLLTASENVPHAPFGRWSDVPLAGQWLIGATYQESEAYHFWADNRRYKVDHRAGGEHYGIDMNQGFLSFQYGLTDRWAADLAVGGTTSGWRFFSNEDGAGKAQSTQGLMDSALGVRYQLAREADQREGWVPTLTFRAGAVLPGTFRQRFAFAPGTRSVAIEPELIFRKHFGWEGLGLYGDGLFRWNRTTANDQYILSGGLFQEIHRWELACGYRRLASTSGDNIHFDPDTRRIEYPVGVKEINDAIEAGFSYTTSRSHVRWGFQSRLVVDGNNTDQKFWIGASVELPLGGPRSPSP